MTEQKKRGRPAGSKRVLQPKVTVMSVRREWETKHAELQASFDKLAAAHMNLAKVADELDKSLADAQKMTVEALAEALRKEGVIRYLEQKIGSQRDDSND